MQPRTLTDSLAGMAFAAVLFAAGAIAGVIYVRQADQRNNLAWPDQRPCCPQCPCRPVHPQPVSPYRKPGQLGEIGSEPEKLRQ